MNTSENIYRYDHKYFYFTVPAKLNVKIQCAIPGLPKGSLSLYNRGGKLLRSFGTSIYSESDWSYKRIGNKSSLNKTVTLNKGGYYIDFYYYGDKTCPYSLALTGHLTNKITLTNVAKRSKTSIKITWRKTSGMRGYQIFSCNTKNGTYKKVKTLSSGKSSYTDSKLLKGENYYCKVRAYKKIGSKIYYSPFSSPKLTKL